MVNHGLTTGALFACVGVIYERYHTREMAELGGLWNRLPLLAFFLILSSLGSAAVPGLNGFVGEFPILAGHVRPSPTGGRAGGDRHDPRAPTTCSGWSRRVLFGPLREPHDGHGDHGAATRRSTRTPQGTTAVTPRSGRWAGTRSPAWRR